MQPIPFRSLSADFHQSLVDLAATDSGLLRIDAVEVARLPTVFLAACQQVAAQGVRVGLMNLADPVRCALSLIDGQGLPEDLAGILASPFSDGPPFTVVVAAEGALIVTALPGICSHPRLATRDTYAWLNGLQMPAITVDLGVVDHVNSVLVSWLLQVSQHASPVKPRLVNASRSIAVQMARLRLDHLVDITPV